MNTVQCSSASSASAVQEFIGGSSSVSISSAVFASDSAVVGTARTARFIPWPLVYDLPPFPGDLHRTLMQARSTSEITAATHRLVIRILYEQIVQYTLLVFFYFLKLITVLTIAILNCIFFSFAGPYLLSQDQHT